MIGVFLHCAVMEVVKNLCNDAQVLKSIWFGKITGSTHKERLESFYGPQAHVCKFAFSVWPFCFRVFADIACQSKLL